MPKMKAEQALNVTSEELRKEERNFSEDILLKERDVIYLNNRAMLNKAIKMGLRPVICVAQDYIKNAAVDDPRLRKALLDLPDNKTEIGRAHV